MNRYYLKLILTIALLSFPCPSHAQTPKTITLKDGSVLKGEVTQLADGVYTLETTNLGKVNVAESEVISITTEGAAQTTQSTQSESLKSQAHQIQGNLLSNPEIMAEMQNLMQDEEIRGVLSDPAFMNAIFSYDPNKIQQNEKTQYLLQNPKFQSLLEKIQKKLSDGTSGK